MPVELQIITALEKNKSFHCAELSSSLELEDNNPFFKRGFTLKISNSNNKQGKLEKHNISTITVAPTDYSNELNED
jgi:hypothetical protein